MRKDPSEMTPAEYETYKELRDLLARQRRDAEFDIIASAIYLADYINARPELKQSDKGLSCAIDELTAEINTMNEKIDEYDLHTGVLK